MKKTVLLEHGKEEVVTNDDVIAELNTVLEKHNIHIVNNVQGIYNKQEQRLNSIFKQLKEMRRVYR